MIQPIVHDPLFLAQKSAPATPADADTARDLLETLTATPTAAWAWPPI